MELSSATPTPALACELTAALGGLLEHQRDMTRLFSVGTDILNAARALDSMAFELQLLARNGVVQAAQLNQAADAVQGGAGRSLMALAEILSTCPREIAPALLSLGNDCRAIATHTAQCMNLARRHAQLLKALLLVLAREAGDEHRAGFTQRLTRLSLRRVEAPVALLQTAADWDLSPALRANLELLADRCQSTLRGLAAHLSAAADCLRQTDLALHAIARVAGTVDYLGVNVAIEAAHCAARGTSFHQLAADIDATVTSLEHKLLTIRDSAERGHQLTRLLGT